MNCRFCGSFIPDGYNACDVCGRRIDERPMGELLSEYQPETFMHGGNKPSEESGKKVKKSIIFPLLVLLISGAALAYCFTAFASELQRVFMYIVSLNFDALISLDNASAVLIFLICIVLTVLVVIGLVTFISRIFNRAVHREIIYG